MKTENSIENLEKMADKLRIDSIKSTTAAKSGHPTSCMSIAEIMSTLFFSEMGKEDEFILSKGHAVPILWSVYAEMGLIPFEELKHLRHAHSNLEGHPTPRMQQIRVATGSLGQGLSAGVGMSLSKRIENSPGRVYVIMGDGEVAEGSVWEAANTAAYYKLSNLVAIVDVNRLGQSEATMHGHNTEAYRKKFEAFGWEAVSIDGHSVKELLETFKKARNTLNKPFAIIAKTFKGKGVSFTENKEGWHGRPMNEEEAKTAIEEIGETDIKLKSKVRYKDIKFDFHDFPLDKYNIGDEVATRVAFGNILPNIGKTNDKVVVIDADVKNSTMTESFFKKFPERSFEAFIAEQNMVGMAIGFSAAGYIPFLSTFSTFLTRSHDFIRMAQYSNSNIKFVGSHAGVSIGEDGPSQMGLEDVSMFLSMPNSVILYPSDAVSTEYLTREMMKHVGISYLRTTRGKTPVIYNNDEEFPIGGLKVIRKTDNDKALIITAGITIPEALKAHDILKEKDINVRVIDLYSIQPLDVAKLLKESEEVGNNTLVVEDHYCYGIASHISGYLSGVNKLCIREIPRSGRPQELMEKFGITAGAIVDAVEKSLGFSFLKKK